MKNLFLILMKKKVSNIFYNEGSMFFYLCGVKYINSLRRLVCHNKLIQYSLIKKINSYIALEKDCKVNIEFFS